MRKNSNLKSKIKTNIIIIVITLLIIITFFYCIYYSEHNGQISQSTGVITCKEYIKGNEYIKRPLILQNGKIIYLDYFSSNYEKIEVGKEYKLEISNSGDRYFLNKIIEVIE